MAQQEPPKLPFDGIAISSHNTGNASNSQQEQQERAVGILTYASAGEAGIRCVFKQRYTDFQVNEITQDGHVVHLTEVAGPKERLKESSSKRKVTELLSSNEPPKPAGANSPPPVDEALESVHAGQKRSSNAEDAIESKKLKLDNSEQHSTQDNEITSVAGQEPTPAEQNGLTQKGNTSAQELDKPAPVELSAEDKVTLVELFGETVSQDIVKLYSSVVAHPNRKPRDHVTVKTEVIGSKSIRTQAHSVVRRIFNSKLETATLQDEPGRMTVKAAALPVINTGGRVYGQHGNGGQKKGRIMWEELGGEYLHFTLYKENKDTMEILYFLASQLKMKVNIFSFAGTKDRRGVTVQRVAAYRVQKERLMGLTKLARGWKIGSFEYKKHGLNLGDLSGNEFVIALRECDAPGLESLSVKVKAEKIQSIVEKAAKDLGEHGYINFYGLQRFGSFQLGTHTVGTKILQGNLEGAIDNILSYDPAVLPENIDPSMLEKIPRDDIERADAIRVWRETKNVSQARDKMPRRFQAESNIIQFLGRKAHGHKQDKDWQGALMCVQRGLRLMYVHAYQSFVWNHAAVKRREIYGDKVVEGDLVVIGEKEEAKPEDTTDQDGEVVVHPSESAEDTEDAFVRARPLNRQEAESGRWSIFDVVLPLPGWDVHYPANEVGKFYETFMGSEEGGELDPHNMRRSWKDASLSGGYRKMMSRPLHGKVEVETKIYCGDEQLAPTDADRLVDSTEVFATDAGTQEKVAVVLKLQLGSSQYATMALRELTKGNAEAYKPEFSAARKRGD